MYILSFFTENGLPKTGLNAIVKVLTIPGGVVVVNNEAMSELGDGFYYYNFAGYDYTKDYAIKSDGSGVLADAERYQVAGNESFVDDINSVITENESIKRLLGLMHENIFIDNPVYDGDNNLINARVRIYSDAASVGTAVNVIGTYTITSVGSGAGTFTSWAQEKV